MNFMERISVFLMIFLMTGVFAADDWDSINGNSGSVVEQSSPVDDKIVNNSGFSESVVSNEISAGDDVFSSGKSSSDGSSSGDSTYYTPEFYVALVLIVLVLVIIGFAMWLFLRGPRDKWDKKSGFLDKYKIKIKK